MPINRSISQELRDTYGVAPFTVNPENESSPSNTFCNILSQPIILKVYDFGTTTVPVNKKVITKLDCTQFTSSEIIVKVIGRDITVEAKQKEQREGENGSFSLYKSFKNVSDSYDLEKAEALLGLGKVLTLYAPRTDKKPVDKESPNNIEESCKSLNNVEKEIQNENYYINANKSFNSL